VFKPVELEGTTVRRASLCNISECERLGIGGQGSVLSVIKANKIIPKVVSVEQKAGQLQIPGSCPVCHHEARVEVSKVSGTKTLHCTNPDCPAKQLRKFSRFVSKEGMNIDGISEQTLAKFINLGWIREYADIYKLNNHIREIASLDGFGERSARNMMQAINRSRTVDARNLLIALSIPKCGPDVAKRLLASYSIDDVLKLSENTLFSELDLKDIDGIGPEREAIIKEWFRNPANISMLNNLLSEVSVTQPHSEPAGNSCEGLTFVITGDVHHFKNRNELKAYIESQGGKVTGSVSKSTSFLINNDIESTSGKNKKAQQLQIPIISEDDFIERFGAEN
jgi:DNA ligase (NAD+)